MVRLRLLVALASCCVLSQSASSLMPSPCSASIHFDCGQGRIRCIPFSRTCDGWPDCENGSDELNCNDEDVKEIDTIPKFVTVSTDQPSHSANCLSLTTIEAIEELANRTIKSALFYYYLYQLQPYAVTQTILAAEYTCKLLHAAIPVVLRWIGVALVFSWDVIVWVAGVILACLQDLQMLTNQPASQIRQKYSRRMPQFICAFWILWSKTLGYNETTSIAFWLGDGAGKWNINVQSYRNPVNISGCDPFDTLVDYDIPRDSTQKKFSKAMDKTQYFTMQMFEQDVEIKASFKIIKYLE